MMAHEKGSEIGSVQMETIKINVRKRAYRGEDKIAT